MANPGDHIFYHGLKGAPLDFEPIRVAWASIDDDRLEAYRQAVPDRWGSDKPVDDALDLIRGVRDHIEDALAELRRVLS